MKKYVEDPTANHHINIIKQHVDDGLSDDAIAELLNEAGESHIKDGQWSKMAVAQIRESFRLDELEIDLTEFTNQNQNQSKVGKVVVYDGSTGKGKVIMRNGERKSFDIDDWLSPEAAPAIGQDIQFTNEGIKIYKKSEMISKAGKSVGQGIGTGVGLLIVFIVISILLISMAGSR